MGLQSRTFPEQEGVADPDDKRDPAAVALGRKGGKARAESLSKKRRAEIAKKAAAKRWGRKRLT